MNPLFSEAKAIFSSARKALFAMLLFLGVSTSNATDSAHSVVTESMSRLVVDCENITTDSAKVTGSDMAEFIKEETLSCNNAITSVVIPETSDTRVISAGQYLVGTVGSEYFGQYLTNKRFVTKNLQITGLPKVVEVISETGAGANFKVTSVGVRYSSILTSVAGTYTVALYGHVKAMHPISGGAGYKDIQSIRVDWTGVKVSGAYAVATSDGSEKWTDFEVTGAGTSTISSEDIRFTTGTNTSTGHCATLANPNYNCSFSESYKQVIEISGTADSNGGVSCAAVKDLIDAHPEYKEKFICKNGATVIDCSTIEKASLTCKDSSGTIVSCTQVADKNACYESGNLADDFGYKCYYGSTQVSCTAAGYEGSCSTYCQLNGSNVSCNEVVNMNDCAQYGLYTDQMGYTCYLNGSKVSCSTFGQGSCAEQAKCMKNSDQISCDIYKNVLACAAKYNFTPSTQYWCKTGNIRVSCDGMVASQSCNASSAVCYDAMNNTEIDCGIIQDYNACEPYGSTSLNFSSQYRCTLDDAVVPCTVLGKGSSDDAACPLPKKCRIASMSLSVECEHLNDARQCETEGYGNYTKYYSCEKGNASYNCAWDTQAGNCDLNICAGVCPYQGVTLDGTTDTCVCLDAPVCVGMNQTGTNYCNFGGSAKGQGTRECVCSPEPNCMTLCEWQGVSFGKGTSLCTCNEKKDCDNPSICAYGGSNKPDGTCECLNTPSPSCSGATQYYYYGATKIAVQTVAQGYCTYGGICSGQESDADSICATPNCPYGASFEDPNKKDLSKNICPYGSSGDALNCSSICSYGFTSSGAITKASDCICNVAPICSGSSQTGTNRCDYGGSARADGTQGCNCNSAPNCSTQCSWGGTPKVNGTSDCTCNSQKNCSNATICAYGGTNKADGTCNCKIAPVCSGTAQTGTNKCPNGGEPAADGTQACFCNPIVNQNCTEAAICPYGGVNKSDGSCMCSAAPECSGTLDEQTGTNQCTYGGYPKANGTKACTCYEAPSNCSHTNICLYGGVPNADGTQNCTCNAEPDCSAQCTNGGLPKADGTASCTCYGSAICNGTSQTGSTFCSYGGTAKYGTANECLCNDAPICEGALEAQTGTNKCEYGGTPKGTGSPTCDCNAMPTCGLGSCAYGGTPKANGTTECTCEATPDCSTQCPYGGKARANGTQECACADGSG